MSYTKTVYLDHAATSYPKPAAVTEAVIACMKQKGGNPGRGSHRLSLEAAREIYTCRERAALLFEGEPERVIFTANTTHVLNIALKGLLRPGDHALCSDMEHNAVYRPLVRLSEERGISFDTFDTAPASPVRSTERILASLAARLRPHTRLVVCAHGSNICSATLPLEAIGRFCRANGLVFVVDGAQTAGAWDISMERMHIDALCLPGHKGLLGPQGTGMLILGTGIHPDTLFEGGNGIDSLSGRMGGEPPELYEAGTLPTPAVAGLSAGLEHVRTVGVDTVRDHECRLAAWTKEALLELPRVTLYAPMHEGATLLFSVKGYTADEVGAFLDRNGICVRAGFHCTALGHRTLRTPSDGAVRVSFGWSSRQRDAEALLRALKRLP